MNPLSHFLLDSFSASFLDPLILLSLRPKSSQTLTDTHPVTQIITDDRTFLSPLNPSSHHHAMGGL